MIEEKHYVESMLKPLIGFQVVECVAATDEDGDVWPVIVLASLDGKEIVVQLEIARDGEGNGPGAVLMSRLLGENFENGDPIYSVADWKRILD